MNFFTELDYKVTLEVNGLIFLFVMVSAPTVSGTRFAILNMHSEIGLLSHFLIFL